MKHDFNARSLATSLMNVAIDTKRNDESIQKLVNDAFGNDIRDRIDGKEGDKTGYIQVIASVVDQCGKGKERVKNDAISIFTRRVNRLAKATILSYVTKGVMKAGTVHVPNMTRKTHKGNVDVDFKVVKMVASNKAKPGTPPRYQLEEPAKPASYAEAFKVLNDKLSHIPGGNWAGFKAWAEAEIVRLQGEAVKSVSGGAAAIVSTKAPVKPTIPRPVGVKGNKAKAPAKIDIDKELAKELAALQQASEQANQAFE